MTQISLRIAEADARIVPREAPYALQGARHDPLHEPEAQTIDLGRIFLSVRRQRKLVGLWMLAAVLAGLGILATTPRTYEAWATVLLDAQLNRSIAEASAMDSGEVTESMLESAIQVIRSQTLAKVVVNQLALDRNPVIQSPAPSGLARGTAALRSMIRASVEAARNRLLPPTLLPPLSAEEQAAAIRQETVRTLQGQIKVARIGRSNALALGFASQDPALSSQVANAYAESYVADLLNANLQATELTTRWMQTRLGELETASRDAALAAEEYRASHGLVRADGGLVAEQNVGRLNADLIDASAEAARARVLAESLDAALVEASGRSDLAGSLTFGGTGDTRLTTLQDELVALQVRLERVVRDHGTSHPQASRLRDEMDEVGRRILTELSRRAEAARSDAAVADARVAALREGLGLAVDTSTATGPAMVELRALEQRARTMAALYETMLTRLATIDQQKSFPVTDVRILSAAEAPKDPVGPRTTPTLGIALVLGGLIGLVHAMIREWRDRYLRTAADVIEGVGMRFLGYLPNLPRKSDGRKPKSARAAKDGSGSEPSLMFASRQPGLVTSVQPSPRVLPAILAHLPVHEDPDSFFAETLRSIRLALDLDLDRAGPGGRVIGITSLRPGEGKTTVALNLAGVLAAGGGPAAAEGTASVLLIDADPRSPGLTRALMPQGQRAPAGGRTPNLADVLSGRLRWSDALHAIAGTGIDFLGAAPPHRAHRPAEGGRFDLSAPEALGSPHMAGLITEARSLYRYVVVDLSPLGPLVDARVLIPHLDRVAIVAEWGKLPRQLLADLLAAEPLLATRLLGVVLNKVDFKALKSYTRSGGPEQFFDEYQNYIAPAMTSRRGA